MPMTQLKQVGDLRDGWNQDRRRITSENTADSGTSAVATVTTPMVSSHQMQHHDQRGVQTELLPLKVRDPGGPETLQAHTQLLLHHFLRIAASSWREAAPGTPTPPTHREQRGGRRQWDAASGAGAITKRN